MATILVTDGEQRAALAAVRSLGAAGHRVLVGGPRRGGLAARSRRARGGFELPSPLARPDRFGDVLAEEARQRRADVLLPVTEPSILAVLDRRELFRDVVIPFPDAGAFRRAARKDELEGAVGDPLRTPVQHVLECPAEAAGLELRFPVVVKPARSVVELEGDAPGGREKTSVAYARDRAALDERLAALPAGAFPVLLQERVEGDGVGLFYLLQNGEVRARFAHRRLREKPPSGGVSVLRESIAVPEAWFEAGAELLRHLGWEGVAMVELKVDASSGAPYVMEVNPRLWGSLQLAVDAGVDFPRLLVAQALGEAVESVLDYRVGVRTRWTLGDLDHLVARLRRSKRELLLPPGAPGRARAMLDFLLAFLPPSRGEVFRLGDPLPGLVEIARWPRAR